MKAAAREMHYDSTDVSRVLNGKQRPSKVLALALDAVTGSGGALAATVLNDDDVSHLITSE